MISEPLGLSLLASSFAFLDDFFFFVILLAIYLFSVLWVWTRALTAALIWTGSSGQTATISARSEGSSEGSIVGCFGDSGVN